MGRVKKDGGIQLRSVEDCGAAMEDLLLAQLQLEGLVADRDAAVAKAAETYKPSIDAALEMAAALEGALKGYYYAHLAEMEAGGGKHFQLPNGVMGRRDNPAKLAPLNRNWTWAAIKVRVRELFDADYFHEPKEPELDKERLKTLPEEELKNVGLKLVAEETFYCEPARLPGAVEAA
jgi:hypothetical protein